MDWLSRFSYSWNLFLDLTYFKGCHQSWKPHYSLIRETSKSVSQTCIMMMNPQGCLSNKLPRYCYSINSKWIYKQQLAFSTDRTKVTFALNLIKEGHTSHWRQWTIVGHFPDLEQAERVGESVHCPLSLITHLACLQRQERRLQ